MCDNPLQFKRNNGLQDQNTINIGSQWKQYNVIAAIWKFILILMWLR